MKRKEEMHFDLPRIPENEFLFKPRHEADEDRQGEEPAGGTNVAEPEDTIGK